MDFMFLMSGTLGLGNSNLAASLVSRRDMRGHVLRRDALTFDTRFAAPLNGAIEAVANLFVFVRGTTQIYSAQTIGLPNPGPAAYLLRDDEIDRVSANTTHFLRSYGEVVEVVHLRFNLEDIRCPAGLAQGALALSPVAFAAAKRLPGLIGSNDIVPAIRQFGLALQACGVLREGMFDAEETIDVTSRLLGLIADRYRALDTATTLKEIAHGIGLSLRHVGRTFESAVAAAGLPSAGFREDSRIVRLRLAVLLLGGTGLNVTQVADKVGYSGVVAMSRAFRDAGLPAPGDVRRAMATPLLPSAQRAATGSIHEPSKRAA